MPFGDKYHATIKHPTWEEILEDEYGQHAIFDSATRAMAKAIAECRDRAVAASIAAGAGGMIVEKLEFDDSDGKHIMRYTASWLEAKAVEAQKSRDLHTLRNVKVVRRKRRA